MKEELLISVEIERDDDDFRQLAQLKSAMTGMKEEQKALNQAFKEGKITRQEHSNEIVRLEANYKKINATYQETQRKVTGLKAPFQDIKTALSDQAKQVNVAGLSLSNFANPVTATVALLGGLFKAYSSSTIGAKDLSFAQNQLSAATRLLTNDFASLFSSADAGEGFFSQITNFVLAGISPAAAAISKFSAENLEKLEDLTREEKKIRGEINERLSENQELTTKIQDSQTDINEKVHSAGLIIDNIRKNETDLLDVKKQQLELLNKQLGVDKENDDLKTTILDTEQEISRIQKDSTRQVEAVNRMQSNILETEQKRVQTAKEQNAEIEKQAGIAKLGRELAGQKLDPLKQLEKETELTLKKADATRSLAETTAHLAEEVTNANEKQKKAGEDFKKTTESEIALNQLKLANASLVIGMITSLTEKGSAEYKALAIAQALIDTYRAATAALTPPPIGLGPLAGLPLAAVTTAVGLANVAKIASFDRGGYTGPGERLKPAGIVHAGEVVWSQKDVAAVGGPRAADAMRPTFSGAPIPKYATGGIVNPLPGYFTGGQVMPHSGINEKLLLSAIDKRIKTYVPVLVMEEVELLAQRRIEIRENARI